MIKTRGEKLFIVGGEKRGTLYGIYDYLERYLGCRFYAPKYEKIPTIKTIELPCIDNDKHIPIIETRNPGWASSFDHEFSTKLKINGSHCRGDFSEELGGNLTWAGNPWHSLYTLAEMEGNSFNHEPCLSDEKVYETVLKNVRKLLAQKPGAKYISVSQNDSDLSDWSCKCEKCQAVYEQTGSRAGLYIKFVNRIAAAIKDEYPDVMVHTFAYKFTREAPKNIEVVDNVMVQFCTIEACFRHPFEECQSSLYERPTDFKRLLGEWAKVCKYLSVWDYTTNFWRYNLCFPNLYALYDNIQLFANNNVRYVFAQGNHETTNGEFSELRAYLLARLLWEPYMTREKYLSYMYEFINDYYGDGGAKIREFIELLHKQTESTCVFCYDKAERILPNSTKTVREADELPCNLCAEQLISYEKTDWTPYFDWFTEYVPNPVLAKGKLLFEEAYKLAKTAEQKSHIEQSAVQVSQLELCFAFGRIPTVEKNVYDIAYGLGKKLLTDKSEEEIVTLANEIKNFAAKQAKEQFIALNKAYFDSMIKFGLIEREGQGRANQRRLIADGNYDFEKFPWEW